MVRKVFVDFRNFVSNKILVSFFDHIFPVNVSSLFVSVMRQFVSSIIFFRLMLVHYLFQ